MFDARDGAADGGVEIGVARQSGGGIAVQHESGARRAQLLDRSDDLLADRFDRRVLLDRLERIRQRHLDPFQIARGAGGDAGDQRQLLGPRPILDLLAEIAIGAIECQGASSTADNKRTIW